MSLKVYMNSKIWVCSFRVIWIWISNPRSHRSWYIQDLASKNNFQGFIASFWCLEWSLITDPDSGHPYGTHILLKNIDLHVTEMFYTNNSLLGLLFSVLWDKCQSNQEQLFEWLAWMVLGGGEAQWPPA